MSQPPPPSQMRLSMSQPPPPSQMRAASTTPNTPSAVDEYDSAFPPFSESILQAVDVIEQHEHTSDPTLPKKRLLTPKKNAPSSIHALAAQRKAAADAEFPQNTTSTPPRPSRQPLRSPFASVSSDFFQPYAAPMAGHHYAHPFGATAHPSYHTQHATLNVPPGFVQSNPLAGPGIPSGYPNTVQATTAPAPPPLFPMPAQVGYPNAVPTMQVTAASVTPTPTPLLSDPPQAEAMLPLPIEGGTGRPTNTEAQGLLESFAELDSLLEKLAERLGSTPDLLLSRYLANDSRGRVKGKDNPWNTYQSWVLNNDAVLIQEMQRLEDETSEDIKWDGHSHPDAQQLRLAFSKFKEDVSDWEEILREAKVKATLTGQLQRYRRKAFENIFERIKSLLETADNRYGFSGVAMFIGNNVNQDQSLAHIHATCKVETFAEDCCLTDRAGLLGHLRSLAYQNVRREVLKEEVLAAAERLDISLQSPTEGPSSLGVNSTSAAAPTSTPTTSTHNASSIIFGVKVPNYSSESKLTDAARIALLRRANEGGLGIEKLYWKSLHTHMIKAGLVIVNWPHSVLQPWTLSSSSSKGIAKLDKASRMTLVAACHEHCQQQLSFVSRRKADIRNNIVPILSFTPDADGKTKEIFVKDIKMTLNTRKANGKRRVNVKNETDSDSLEGCDSDELDNSDEDIGIAAPVPDPEEEGEKTPTARRSTRAKSQPPTGETVTVKTRAKSQPPKTLSSASTKKVSFQEPDQVTNVKTKPPLSAVVNAPPVNDGSISTSFTSLERLTDLRSKADIKPAIPLNKLDDMVTAGKRHSPPPMDEVTSKRPRYEGPTPPTNMSPSVPNSSTDPSIASAQQIPTPATTLPPLQNPPHFSPAPPFRSDVRPESVPLHPQRYVTPPSTIPQYPTYGFQSYPHHQPPGHPIPDWSTTQSGAAPSHGQSPYHEGQAK